ncbi:MAG TPA: 3-deoxy-D-manno-octulosonic acid transferase [Sutterella sp.]|nr:3-deoxy-D-manno-octulosonic acid transferase [Sutterella sp.]
MPMTSGFYRIIAPVLEPFAALYLLKRSMRQKAYLKGWGERFGFSSFQGFGNRHPIFWIHAVSVGETNAAEPLIDAILKAYPKGAIILTHMTPTGKDAGLKLVQKAPERIVQRFLPYDTVGNARRFFKAVKPDIGLIMETEVWPTFLREAKRAGCPTVLVNGRLSEKSLRAALRWSPLMRDAYSDLTAICAQSASDAERYLKLQDKTPLITGSLKFDVKINDEVVKRAQKDKARCAKKIILLASSREGEEKPFIEAIKAQGRRDILYVLVVRHPQRFDAVAKDLEDAFVHFERRSRCAFDELPENALVYLGDTMGEMAYYCALADVVIMGGSFGNFGSQNVIEPASIGRGVIVGPSTFNFSFVIAEGLKKGGLRQVENMPQAVDLAVEIVSDAALTADFGEKASRFAKSLKGATSKTMRLIKETLKS